MSTQIDRKLATLDKALHDAMAELIASQREAINHIEAAHRQLGMWTSQVKLIQRTRDRIGGAP